MLRETRLFAVSGYILNRYLYSEDLQQVPGDNGKRVQSIGSHLGQPVIIGTYIYIPSKLTRQPNDCYCVAVFWAAFPLSSKRYYKLLLSKLRRTGRVLGFPSMQTNLPAILSCIPACAHDHLYLPGSGATINTDANSLSIAVRQRTILLAVDKVVRVGQRSKYLHNRCVRRPFNI